MKIMNTAALALTGAILASPAAHAADNPPAEAEPSTVNLIEDTPRERVGFMKELASNPSQTLDAFTAMGSAGRPT
ncbi:hypothetical protein [Streptomyces sp. NPDC029554]|uniref:hypothetical protein n=1 Tax=Streptomyces sp. NPDC029554 TaxID=3155126 RepID=UPI0033C47A08